MVKLISLNIRTLYRDTKRQSEHWWVARYRAIHEYIKEQNPDVICLQEVWWPAKYVLRLGKLGYKKTGWGFSHPIFVRKSLRVREHRVSTYATMAIVDEIQYFSVHAHWGKDRFAKAMEWIRTKIYNFHRIALYRVVAAGDFNTSDTKKVREALALKSAREQLGAERVDTFANYKRPTQSHGELDHFFTDTRIDLYQYWVNGSDFSDHRAITLVYDKKK